MAALTAARRGFHGLSAAARNLLSGAALAAVLAAALLASGNAPAQILERPQVVERQLKAAYLYQFAHYVDWPAGAFARPDSPIVIGVIGAEPLAQELARLVAHKKVRGRSLVARRLDRGDPVAGVHILFLGTLDQNELKDVMASAQDQPLLVVSDSRQAPGSMINFVVIDQRLRFEVALAPVARHRIKISALMLTAAHQVKPGTM